MTDTNSTATTDKTQATGPGDGQVSTSGAPAQPSTSEHADTKADAGPSVSQETFDRLHHDYQIVLNALESVKKQLEEAKAHAAKLIEEAKPAAAAVYANAEEEIAALKPRIHDLLAEAKAAADRLADLVHHNHPALNVSGILHAAIQQIRNHI